MINEKSRKKEINRGQRMKSEEEVTKIGIEREISNGKIK